MARKAQEILKARGFSDEELNGLNPRLFAALEAEEVERERIMSENTRVTRDLQNTQKWFAEEANPALLQWQGEVVKTRAEIARLEAQLKAEQDLGMRRAAGDSGAAGGSGQPANTTPANGAPDYTAYDQRYINKDTLTTALNQVPDIAITLYELGENHRELFGKRLNVKELRGKWDQARQNGSFRGSLEDFHAQEYNVAARRTEMAEKEAKDRETKMRQEIRQELASEYMNPATRPPSASNSPFVRKPVAPGTSGGTNDAAGRQPWDRGTVEQRRSERVVKHGTKILSGAA